jgi:hypothetical protein
MLSVGLVKAVEGLTNCRVQLLWVSFQIRNVLAKEQISPQAKQKFPQISLLNS